MTTVSENNKRIAKNTLFLYFRMLLTMLISLFTVRIVLKTLGVADYGIYNVVGGIVIMFSFLSNTMASASQRFFAYELGRKDHVRLKQIFSITFLIYIGIAIIILLLAETIGLWFLNNKMTIPIERIDAANWVYQFSIFSFIMTILTIPYNAVIIAHEKMNIYAYVSIIEVTLKLLIVYLLTLIPFDKLKLYAILTFGVTTLVTFIYRTYCKKKIEECTYTFYWNKIKTKEILSYAWWNMIGAIANILRNQGINILLNIFFNPIVNAAQAIAFQVNTALTNFTNNFYTAIRPQIIKSYSSGNINEMNSLVYQSSKFGFYLMMLLSIPILIETEYILKLWLKILPDYTVLFVRLVIINSLIDIFNYPLVNSIQATGRIKRFQLVVSVIVLMNMPLSYIALYLGYPPETTMLISILISLICFFPRLYFAKIYAQLSIKIFIRNVLLVTFIVYGISIIIPMLIYMNMQESISRFLLITLATLLCSTVNIYLIGTTKKEKIFIRSYFKHD